MSKIAIVKRNISKLAGRPGLILQKHSPEILMGAGVIGVVTATVLACKATLKVEEIIDEAKETLDTIREFDIDDISDVGADVAYTEKDAQKDTALVYIQTGAKLVRLYAPAVAVGGLSVAALVGSHNIMKKRNLAILAAYRAAEESFSSYRRRVIEEFGRKKDEDYRYGLRDEVISVTEEGKDGKKKKKKENIKVIDPNHISQYARFFDEGSAQWSKTPEHNLIFLKATQNYMNDLLIARGHVFLNEVYEALGIPHSQAGAVVGWVRSQEGDNFIDFGIYDAYSEAKRAFVNGEERNVLLDFNVDGVIYDLI